MVEPLNRRARRRARAAGFFTQSEIIRRFLDGTVLHDGPEVPIVAIGPLVWGVRPGDGRREWYFVCGSADASGEFHMDCLTIGDDSRKLAEQARAALFVELVNRRPIVIHEFDDEVCFAGFCAAMWPSPRTRKILKEITADYASRSAGTEVSH